MSSPPATRPFRFGVQLLGAATPAAWIAKARRAEDLGYHVVSIPDHVTDLLAPMPALATLAASTTSIRLGTMVLSNDWRNPVLVAREAATLDWLSEGRLELGLGAGWLREDYDQLGIAYDQPGKRIDRLAEAIDILNDLLVGGSVTRTGRFYTVRGATSYPQSVQRPRPPFVVGGGSRRILSLAGQRADIVNIHTNLGAGQRGGDERPSFGHEAVRDRLAWVAEAAGDRMGTLELGLRIVIAAVTDHRSTTAAQLGSRWQITADDVLGSPHALVGSVDGIAEGLLERRAEFGFSYIVWNESELESFAPVVRRLRDG